MILARQPLKLHLRACVCGARPRYGYEAHVARCEKAKEVAAIKAALDSAGLLDHAPELEPPLAVGQCPKCRRHIGRGLHFHERSCNGRTL